MTPARAIEYRISRNLVERNVTPSGLTGAERTIAVVAGVVALLVLGSLVPGLVFAAVLASTLALLTQ